MKHSSRLSLAAVAAALALAGCASPGYQGDPAYGPASGVPHYGSAPAPAAPHYGGQPAPVASVQPGQMQYGVVRSIEPLRTEASTSGGGAAIGGLLGGVVGNQFGSGSGRAAGTIAGVLGGVLLGNQVEKNQNGAGREIYRVTVQFDNGQSRSFDYHQLTDIRVGDKVRFDGTQVYRQ